VRKRIKQVLTICLLVLAGNVIGIAQETKPAAQEQPSAAAQAAAREKQAAAREKQAAAKALAQQKRALAFEKRAADQEKRIADREKRIALRIASEQRRSIARAIQQVTRPDGTFKLLGSRVGIGKVVKGAPYSATAITEHTQTLSDGNQIIQKNEATYYRDSEGRIRIDQKLKTIGKWTATGEPPRIITIFDPVAGNYYSLDPRTRIALMDVRRVQRSPNPNPNPEPKPEPKAEPKPKIDQHIVVKEGSTREKKKESLGTQVIEGVSAEGTRQTVTIPAGELGNVSPIEIIDENWYSPELQVPVTTRHHDPRSGDTIYRLTNINRSEPARSLFEVPADYRIVDKRAPKLPAQPRQPKMAEPPKKPEDKL
jgi:hypothetical protein